MGGDSGSLTSTGGGGIVSQAPGADYCTVSPY